MENIQKVMGVDVRRWTTVVDGREFSFDYIHLPGGVNDPHVHNPGEYKGGVIVVLSELQLPSIERSCGDRSLSLCGLGEHLFFDYILTTYRDVCVCGLHSLGSLDGVYWNPQEWADETLPHMAAALRGTSNG